MYFWCTIALALLLQAASARFIIKKVGFYNKSGFSIISKPEVLDLYRNSSGEYIRGVVDILKPVVDNKVCLNIQ